MVAVAITGGIGAGKSEALAAFARHGAEVLSSDEIVHRLLTEDDDVRAALRERWGERVLDDRGPIAEIVFADDAEREWLERLLHPRVARVYMQRRAELERAPEPPRLFVVEVPLLYEVGAEERFDAVVVVTAPDDVRSARARVPVEARAPRFIPDEEKVRRADYAYVNDGSLDELDAFVADVIEKIAS